MKKRLFSLLLALLLLLPSCTAADPLLEEEVDYFAETPVEKEEQPTLSVSAFSLPVCEGATLDPLLCSDGVQQDLTALLYEGLFALSPDFRVENRLCSSYTYDAETHTYLFTLRKGVLFGDGSVLTARDVVDSFRRAAASARYKSRFRYVSAYRAVGTDTVRLTLNLNNAAFPALLDIPIVKSGTEKQDVPLGTGRYLYITEEDGDHLLANANYWGGTVSPQEIPLVTVKDGDVAAYRFSGAEVQLLTAELAGASPVSTAGSVQITDAPTPTLHYLGFRMGGLFGDLALRQALQLGIDRGSLVASYLSGHAIPAFSTVSPISAYAVASTESEYDSDAFNAAMSRAGYPRGGEASATVRLLVPEENDSKVMLAHFFAELLRPYGITVQIRKLPREKYLEALRNGQFDLYYASVRMTADFDPRPLLASGASLNYGGYANAELDALMLDYLAAPEKNAAAFCEKFAEEIPILPLFFSSRSVLTQKQVLQTLTPTATDPFYGMENWHIQLAG